MLIPCHRLAEPRCMPTVVAFMVLMKHLKAADPQHTVIMVQVENESGTYGSVRDFGPRAEATFKANVPEKLLSAMGKQPGTWGEVFGPDADEFFHAWSIASYINQVAAAGKAVYPLPMYVNVALRGPDPSRGRRTPTRAAARPIT